MERALDGSGEINLHRLIATILRDEIEDGVLRPGDRLPSEEALRKQFDVSRSTVRQALDFLERDGLVDRQVGRGTFVRVRPGMGARRVRLARDWRGVVALAADVKRLVRRGAAPPNAQVEAIFDSSDPAPFAILVEHEQLGISIKRYIRADLAEHGDLTLEAEDFGAALETALEAEVEIRRFWADAVLAEPRFAMLLKVAPGSPLHSIWWVYESDDRAVGCVHMLIPGGAFSFNVIGEAR